MKKIAFKLKEQAMVNHVVCHVLEGHSPIHNTPLWLHIPVGIYPVLEADGTYMLWPGEESIQQGMKLRKWEGAFLSDSGKTELPLILFAYGMRTPMLRNYSPEFNEMVDYMKLSPRPECEYEKMKGGKL